MALSDERDRAARRTGRGASDARRILLVDCDMFFVQVARLAEPQGAGRKRLLLVGGSPDGRGVVTLPLRTRRAASALKLSQP